MLIFSLPTRRASERVEIWRKLQRHGVLPLRSSGYVLPNTPANQERFEWLATSIRRYKGQASVALVESFDDVPSHQLVKLFLEARARDYEFLAREIRKLAKKRERRAAQISRLRRRFQEIAAIDFFDSPLRSRTESLLAGLDMESMTPPKQNPSVRLRKQFVNRVWITRPRPGIDRVSSAWFIRRFIDPSARFVFGKDADQQPDAVPFDMFGEAGFGHRGEDCTFETFCREFAIRDPRVLVIAQIVHDADLGDEKFGRNEALGLDKVLIGWAQQGVSDDELLRRGMELIEGLYQAVA
ncbi:MAG TPA: chromate resistance protein ChrB domain-containing protein [Candidatus Acidoferrum sp.]|nr:chromate resistance protein ChrB domain-containing protein [Candidatus Acidoferrum sp.]